MNTLDPNPTNELATGQLDPAVEQWLRERGAVFARRTPSGSIEFSTRPLRAALSDAVSDAVRSLRGGPLSSLAPISAPVPAAVRHG